MKMQNTLGTLRLLEGPRRKKRKYLNGSKMVKGGAQTKKGVFGDCRLFLLLTQMIPNDNGRDLGMMRNAVASNRVAEQQDD